MKDGIKYNLTYQTLLEELMEQIILKLLGFLFLKKIFFINFNS